MKIPLCVAMLAFATGICAQPPYDKSAFLHDDVTFECVDPVATFPPLWNISGMVYGRYSLPMNYSVISRVLTYYNVLEEDTFQCIFNNISYMSYSRIATLRIYSGRINELASLKLSDNGLFCFNQSSDIRFMINTIELNLTVPDNNPVYEQIYGDNCTNFTLDPLIGSDCEVYLLFIEVHLNEQLNRTRMFYLSYSKNAEFEECKIQDDCCSTNETTLITPTIFTSKEPHVDGNSNRGIAIGLPITALVVILFAVVLAI